ncbi:MAG: DUF6702 family protein [Bacteroidota bacterium]
MITFLLLLNSLFFIPKEHDFHLSKSVIEYNPESESLEISLHIFLDDLEATLFEGGVKEKLNLCTEKEHEKGETYVEYYLRQSFRIMVNEEEVKYNYIGKEISEDFLAAWCYVEVPNVGKLESLGVKNTILMELYEDQRNIVQIKVPDEKPKFFMFDRKYNEEFVIY